MRKEIKNDVLPIKRIVKSHGDGTVDVELSTGQIGTAKWDFVNNAPIGPIEIFYDKQNLGPSDIG